MCMLLPMQKFYITYTSERSLGVNLDFIQIFLDSFPTITGGLNFHGRLLITSPPKLGGYGGMLSQEIFKHSMITSGAF